MDLPRIYNKLGYVPVTAQYNRIVMQYTGTSLTTVSYQDTTIPATIKTLTLSYDGSGNLSTVDIT